MKTLAITEHSVKFNLYGFVGCFLVEDSDGSLTLIDTGLEQAGRPIVDEIRKRGKPLSRILLTHAHVDHVGGLDIIAAAFPEASVCIGDREAEIYRLAQQGVAKQDFPLHPGEPQKPVKGGFKAVRTDLTHTFERGQAIGPLRVIFTPGHTPGHCSFLDERDGSLYAGDAIISLGKLRSPGDAPWYFPIAQAATWDAGLAMSSLRNLSTLRPERVFAAHGRPITRDVAGEFARAIEHAEKKLKD